MISHTSAFVTSGGLRLHLDIIGSEGAGPAIIFIPGTGCWSEMYNPFLEGLAAQGFRIIGLDPQGHGHSEGQGPLAAKPGTRQRRVEGRGDFSVEELLENIHDAVSFAIATFGERVGLMGSSQGGILTLYAAAGDPRVRSAVCHNAILLKEEAENFLRKFTVARALSKVIDLLARSFPRAKIPTWTYINWKKVMEDRALLKKIYNDPLFVKKYTLRALASLRNAALPRPPEEVRAPIMILTGEHDEVVPPAFGRRVYDRLGSPKKEFAVIPGAHHMLLLEHIPQTLPVVARWFKTTL